MKENVRSRHKEYLLKIETLFKNMRTLLVGQESALSRLVLASLAARPQTVQRGDAAKVGEPSSISGCAHVRLVGPPGIGKTHLASSLALMLNCDFSRIECTPDKQPSDIIGTYILADGGRRSVFVKGPLLNANIILADEISNATPRTQRSLLAGLSEDFIWVNPVNEEVDDKDNKIPLRAPFFFMATQNPLSEQGTYPVPRAILDRFSMTLRFRHLSLYELAMLQEKNEKMSEINGLVQKCLDRETFMSIREFIFTEMKMPKEVTYFTSVIARLLDPSGGNESGAAFRRLYDNLWEQRFDLRDGNRLVAVAKEEIRGAEIYRFSDLIQDALIERAVLFLRYLSKALAFTKIGDGMREYVIPSDVIKLYPDVMFHRIGLTRQGESLSSDWIIDEVIRYAVTAISGAHWFFAELPKLAKENIENG